MKNLPGYGQRLAKHNDTAHSVLQFALDRQIPQWVQVDHDKPVIDIGPGTKVNDNATVVIDYPDYNLDGHITVRGGTIHSGENIHAVEDIFDNLRMAETGNSAPVFTNFLSGRDRLPFGDGKVGGIFAINVLEHLYDPRWLIDEAARVLAPGCPFTIFVPHPDSVMYKQDLDHKSRFVLDTWDNYLNSPYYEKGRSRPPFEVGYNMIHAVKEDNVGILTQLIKKADR